MVKPPGVIQFRSLMTKERDNLKKLLMVFFWHGTASCRGFIVCDRPVF
jgi:hypothetical protein